jgi:hypothetical protein
MSEVMITVRVTEEERERIRGKAERLGESMQAYTRRVIMADVDELRARFLEGARLANEEIGDAFDGLEAEERGRIERRKARALKAREDLERARGKRNGGAVA